MTDLELGVLLEKVARLESWRARIIEVVPAALFIAVLIFLLGELFSIENRLGRMEGKLDRIELKLDAMTWNGKPHAE